MIEDMTMRKFAPKTQHDYVQRVKAPVILSPEGVARFLEAAPSIKYKAALSIAYGAGLRTHHPHVHMIVPGGGIALDGQCWIACRPGFFLPVRVLSRLFCRLFLAKVAAAHAAGRLTFFADHAALADAQAFTAYLAPLRNTEWVIYANRPFGGPEAVLAYLSRYTHRVAIANSRLLALDDQSVTFKWNDYRSKGPEQYKAMTLAIDEFIRRFLIHVLPSGFHRIRHYGLFAKAAGTDNIARARQLLAASQNQSASADAANGEQPPINRCPCFGSRMIIIKRFKRGATPRHQPTAPAVPIRIDTS